MATRFLLAIDGGGMYGIIPAQWAVLIEEQTGRPMSELFDLMAGTSTGSILTAAFATSVSAARVLDLYKARGKDIFKRPRPFFLQLVRPKYRGADLVGVLREYFGEIKLGDVHPLLMLTAFDMSDNTPEFFKSWKPHEQALNVLDVVAASSSAPTYHPMHPIGDRCYTDGGVFAVNPSMSALAEARRLWPEDELVLVSLGTGFAKETRDCREVRSWGLARWGPEIPTVFLEGQQGVLTYQLETLVPTMRLVRDPFRFDLALTRPKRSDETDAEVLLAVADEARRYAEANADFSRLVDLLKTRTAPPL